MLHFSLLAVLLTAKAVALAGRELDLPWWSAPVWIWQDVLVAALLGWVLGRLRRAVWQWTLYGLVVLHAALDVPVARVLGSSFTWPMLRATSGTLGDSIQHHIELANLAAVLAVLVTGVLAPLVWNLARQQWPVVCLREKTGMRALVAGWVCLLVSGWWLGRIVDSQGWHRNPWVALITTALPRVQAEVRPATDWRRSRILAMPEADWRSLAGTAAGRHVVLIALESAGAPYLGLYGAAPDPMPNLSRLAQNALVFDQAYAVYPESIKGLVAVLCSFAPAFDLPAEAYAHLAVPTWPGELAKAGYATGLFHSGRFMYLGMEAVVRGRGFSTLEDAGDIGGNHESSFGVDEPATVDRMLQWIDRLPGGQRFFLTYLPIAGHHPYATPEPGPFPDRTEIDRYRNALHYADRALGRLLAGLAARGLESNTLFIVYGDHGEAFGQHEGNYGHTFALYEENVRVPLVIAAPGLLTGQHRIARPASLLDLAPTTFDLLGLGAGFQGHSLLDPAPRMALFFTDYSLALVGLRDGPWKFIWELGSVHPKLFHLRRDPGERHNLASQEKARVAGYQAAMEGWAQTQKRAVQQALRPSSRPQVARSGLERLDRGFQRRQVRHVEHAGGGIDPLHETAQGLSRP